ncbi:WD40 repeat-like protein [Rhizoclosmatium globosum]|uniref:WD40 repeat-like protein n=1 Tax=Rhizoclosmatium globosum TaxID=329046 RepID=A0A1Y2BK43_9FUNG|nr:WD40 repeat-like protein [Rhizoclosmatium globosum]ORY37888.1 WD40 repeat-like protein [Rhizoclosmatium globosum]|eukprot:ORY35151.1 WD40 repeat-like protein [Rhizoclosmatium globosum]
MSSSTITSDDVNYLVYRYLLESGFTHSTFAFAQEAAVHTRDYLHHHVSLPSAYPSMLKPDDIKGARVPPGALVAFLQRGLLYQEVETHSLDDGSHKKCSIPFSLTQPHECVVESIVPPASTARDSQDDDSDAAAPASKKAKKNTTEDKKDRKEAKRLEREKRAKSLGVDLTNEEDESHLATASDVTVYRPSAENGQTPVGAVYCVGWNPRFMLLAAGSEDGKVRLWRVPSDSSDGIMTECAVTLDHAEPEEVNGVTSLDWHPQGMLLATGSVTGSVKVWTKSGELKYTMNRHTSTVFTLKWNKKGDLLGTASADAHVMIWDASNGELRQQFQCHENAVLDLDWKDDVTFATSSSDKLVYVCRMGYMEPIKVFSGHTADVNGIQWDATNQLLASCSDDHSIKVWSMDSSTPIHTLSGHKMEVFCLRWAPHNPSASTSTTSSTPRILATGSFDFSIRIWDVSTTTGKCVQTLEKHTSQVSALSFSADGYFLASGGFDNVFNVWRCRDWALVKSFKGNGSVFEVQWGVKGDKVSVCFNDGVVAVVHLAGLRDR